MIEDDNIIVLKPEIVEVKNPADYELELIQTEEIQSKGCIQNVQLCYAYEVGNNNEMICEHYHIIIEISSNTISMIICYLCCFTGIITSALGFLINSYCELKCENLLTLYRDKSNRYFLSKYDLEGDQFKNARKTLKENNQIINTIVDLGYLKLQKPHFYKIKCEYCGKILKKGYNMGSLKGAFICGITGIFVLISSVFFLYMKLK